MLVRLQDRLRTLERWEGCDTTTLRRQIAVVEEAIERTRSACLDTWPALPESAPGIPVPAVALPLGAGGHGEVRPGEMPSALPA